MASIESSSAHSDSEEPSNESTLSEPMSKISTTSIPISNSASTVDIDLVQHSLSGVNSTKTNLSTDINTKLTTSSPASIPSIGSLSISDSSVLAASDTVTSTILNFTATTKKQTIFSSEDRIQTTTFASGGLTTQTTVASMKNPIIATNPEQPNIFAIPPSTQGYTFGNIQTTQSSIFGMPQTMQASNFISPLESTSTAPFVTTRMPVNVSRKAVKPPVFGYHASAITTQTTVFGSQISNQISTTPILGISSQSKQGFTFVSSAKTPQASTSSNVYKTGIPSRFVFGTGKTSFETQKESTSNPSTTSLAGSSMQSLNSSFDSTAESTLVSSFGTIFQTVPNSTLTSSSPATKASTHSLCIQTSGVEVPKDAKSFVGRFVPEPSTVPIPDEWCTTEPQVREFTYMWIIKNFSSFEKETGRKVESEPFSIDENDASKWCLRADFFYYNDYLSFKLTFSPAPANQRTVTAKVKYSLLNDQWEKIEEQEKRARIFSHEISMDKEHDYIIHRKTLFDQKQSLLPEDKLTIICEISIVEDFLNISGRNFKVKIPECSLSDNLEVLFCNELFSDVTLDVGGKEFRAHKAILAARSSVFAALLEKEDSSHISITDVGPDMLEEILRFIYTGCVLNLEEKAADLMAAADKYELNPLKMMCKKVQRLTRSTLAEIRLSPGPHGFQQYLSRCTDQKINDDASTSNEPGSVYASLKPDAWCITEVKVQKFNYIWAINKFSCFKQPFSEWFYSTAFSTDANDTTRWRLKLNVFKKPELTTNISIKLELLFSKKTEVTAKCKFSVLNRKRERTCVKEVELVSGLVPGRYIEVALLTNRCTLSEQATSLVPEDKLTILCEGTVIEGIVHTDDKSDRKIEKNAKVKVTASRLSDDLGSLFCAQRYPDVTLGVGPKEFSAHKAVLTARSPVFAAMFEHEMMERMNNRVEISDTDPAVVREMLNFIYTGRAPNLDNMAAELLNVADKYALDQLKAMCEEALCRCLTADNVLDLLDLADMHSAHQLKEGVIDFINRSRATSEIDKLGWNKIIDVLPELLVNAFKAVNVEKTNTHM